MYVPSSFNVDDPAQIEAFLRQHVFATLISPTAAGPVATHVPLLVRRGPTGLVLVGHVARANRHWESMTGASEDLATQPPAGAIGAPEAGGLIVEDDVDRLAPGQMRKRDFLASLRGSIGSAAPPQAAMLADKPAADIEQLIHRLAPESVRATDARQYVSIAASHISV